jgi:hypothetical protein
MTPPLAVTARRAVCIRGQVFSLVRYGRKRLNRNRASAPVLLLVKPAPPALDSRQAGS